MTQTHFETTAQKIAFEYIQNNNSLTRIMIIEAMDGLTDATPEKRIFDAHVGTMFKHVEADITKGMIVFPMTSEEDNDTVNAALQAVLHVGEKYQRNIYIA